MRASVKSFVVIFAFFIFTASSQAATKQNGIGIVLGEPTGITFKHYFSASNAFDVGIGQNFLGGSISVHADYLWEKKNLFSKDGRFPLYFGPGVILYNSKVLKNTVLGLGVQGLLGVEFFPANIDFSFFGELSLQLHMVPALSFGLGGGIGARYWFSTEALTN